MARYSERITTVLDTDCGRTLQELVPKLTAAEVKSLMEAAAGKGRETPAQLQRAVYVLGRLGKREALDVILGTLPNLDAGGRLAAADALGRLGGAKARKELVALSADKDAQVRKFAVKGLGRIGDKGAKDTLKAVAAEDRESWLRSVARKELDRAK